MATRTQAKKPYRTLEQGAFIGLQRAADALARGVEETLKAADLSLTQYNVLRILRGAGPEGLACGEVGGRMLTRDPDITRLLDRLEARRLVARARERADRRVVRTRITEAGLRLLQELDAPIAETHRRQLGHLGSARLRALIRLLDLARSKAG